MKYVVFIQKHDETGHRSVVIEAPNRRMARILSTRHELEIGEEIVDIERWPE